MLFQCNVYPIVTTTHKSMYTYECVYFSTCVLCQINSLHNDVSMLHTSLIMLHGHQSYTRVLDYYHLLFSIAPAFVPLIRRMSVKAYQKQIRRYATLVLFRSADWLVCYDEVAPG